MQTGHQYMFEMNPERSEQTIIRQTARTDFVELLYQTKLLLMFCPTDARALQKQRTSEYTILKLHHFYGASTDQYEDLLESQGWLNLKPLNYSAATTSSSSSEYNHLHTITASLSLKRTSDTHGNVGRNLVRVGVWDP